MYVRSRDFILSSDPEEMTEAFWLNMWTKCLWPFRELLVGDTLLWYETPSRSVKWRSEVTRVDTFEYSSKHEAGE